MEQTKSSWVALGGLSIANLIGCLDLTVVNTALPAIQTSLSLDKLQLQWIMNILFLSLASFMVIAGKLADRYGRRSALYVGMALFAITSLGAGLAQSFHTLIIFRFFQGIAIAILYTAPVALVPALFPKNTGKAMGILFGASGFGLAVGPALGGVLTTLFSWHAIFFINLPIILLSFILCCTSLPKGHVSSKDKIDVIGAFLLMISLPILVFAIVNIKAGSLETSQIVLLTFVLLILFLLFAIRETKISFPIIDFRLFFNRKFSVGLCANFFLAFFYSIDLFFIPLHLSHAGNFSSERIGEVLLLPILMVAFLSPLSGFFCDRFGAKSVLSMGYVFFILSAFLQIAFYYSASQFHLLLIPYVFFGMGWAFILSPSLVTAMSALPEGMGGLAIGTIGTLHNIGGMLGLAIGSAMSYFNAMHLILITSALSLFIILFSSTKFQPQSKLS